MPIVSGGGGGASVPTLAIAQVNLTSGDVTTNSTTFVDATGVTVTLTTGARRTLVTLTCNAHVGSAGAGVYFDIAVDGTRQGGTNGLSSMEQTATAGNAFPVSISLVTAVLSAASHTIKAQWRVSGNTGTLVASATAPAILTVTELLQTT